MSETYAIVSDQNNDNIVIDHLWVEKKHSRQHTPKELNSKDFHKMYSFYKFYEQSSASGSILLLWSQIDFPKVLSDKWEEELPLVVFPSLVMKQKDKAGTISFKTKRVMLWDILVCLILWQNKIFIIKSEFDFSKTVSQIYLQFYDLS